jgi:hypothetical protein
MCGDEVGQALRLGILFVLAVVASATSLTLGVGVLWPS